MLRLIQAHLASAGKLNHGDRTPAFFVKVRTRNALGLERRDLGFHVIAHKIKLMPAIVPRGMNSQLGRRQSEDQPSMAYIDERKTKNIAQKNAIRLRILAIDDDMRAKDHVFSPFYAACYSAVGSSAVNGEQQGFSVAWNSINSRRIPSGSWRLN